LFDFNSNNKNKAHNVVQSKMLGVGNVPGMMHPVDIVDHLHPSSYIFSRHDTRLWELHNRFLELGDTFLLVVLLLLLLKKTTH